MSIIHLMTTTHKDSLQNLPNPHKDTLGFSNHVMGYATKSSGEESDYD